MAALWCDGFDYLATADLLERYSTTGGTPEIVDAVGRRSSAGLRLNHNSDVIRQTVAATGTTAILGVALNAGSEFTNSPKNFISILDGASTQVGLRMNTDRSFSVLRGSTVLATSTYTFPIDSYVYLELKVVLDNVSGSVEARINGESVVTLTGVDTVNTATAQWTAFALEGVFLMVMIYDDLYVLDGSGSDLNDFLGDVRVDAHRPTADGAHSAFTPSTGADHYALVDDTTPDDDSTYNETNTLNAIDTFDCADLAAPGASIRFVEVINRAKKTDAGDASIAPIVRYNSTDYSGTAAALSTDYRYYSQIYEQNPGTSAAWTETDFEATEFGYKKTV